MLSYSSWVRPSVRARYKLHIGLRHTKSPLPGSPFDLVVVPGAASPVTTMVPKGLPKRGYVGSKKDEGGFEMSLPDCMQVLTTAPRPLSPQVASR